MSEKPADAAKRRREERLAAQLKENLKRRKAQARAKTAAPGTSDKAGETPPKDRSGPL